MITSWQRWSFCGIANQRAQVYFAFILLLTAACASAATHEKQCVWTNVSRIVAIGDVHGDYGQFVTTLRSAKVIDDRNRWIGGKTHLVQTGDVLDRAANSRKAMDLLMDMERQAAKADGHVHALIGNHECMVLMGDYRYVHDGEFDSFGGREGFVKAFSKDGKYGRWIRSHNTVIKINDVLFLHGGLTANYAAMRLTDINRAARNELSGKANPAVTHDPSGPMWYRGLALRNDAGLAEEVETILERQDAGMIVIGHTVSRSSVQVRAGGRVIMIDVGMSKYYGGSAACLLIEKGRYYAVRGNARQPLPVAGAKKGKSLR